MPKTTTKPQKSIYQDRREALGLSREKASVPHSHMFCFLRPGEVLTMAEKYQDPQLCNHYCAHECEIGKRYVPEIRVKELPQIVLEMLASLNSVKARQDRLIEITADGRIAADEVEDFVSIQNELERISVTVETLQLWAEKKIANGEIDMEAYRAVIGRK